MDRLTMLASFVRVCEAGSFSAAARELGVSQPAVSQQIRTLEARLGVRLFDRTTRSVSPTEAGARYLDHARDVLERLDEADRTVGCLDRAMCGRLVVGAPVGFGSSVLARYLVDFKRAYPDLLLDVALTDRFVDVIAERLDVMIRMGAIADDRLVVRRLGAIGRRLAATPDYLDRKGRPRRPEDLAAHDYLLYAQLPERVSLTGPAGERVEVQPRPTFRSDNSVLTRELLLAGLGIGLGHEIVLAPLVAEGRLEYVLPEWRYDPHQVHAVYPSNRYIPLKVRRFVDGFAEHLRTLGALVATEPATA
ncbi:LysR family transcriptional regulator [Arenibaculum sp.]|jgi:DNA-binding transcriptional LysR family regulator|uniref:LysR family transcriptional regulator n=1 Tax=Arenibaculum sp. TaxID=2865862 RepID=UPI002E0E68B3|nr:LysR family transcriptional regulator [Arenibaculum sp.]